MALTLHRGFPLEMLHDSDHPISTRGIWAVHELPGMLLFSLQRGSWVLLPARTSVSPDHPFRRACDLARRYRLAEQQFATRRQALQALEAILRLEDG